MLWHMFDAQEQARIKSLLRKHQEDYETRVCACCERGIPALLDMDSESFCITRCGV